MEDQAPRYKSPHSGVKIARSATTKPWSQGTYLGAPVVSWGSNSMILSIVPSLDRSTKFGLHGSTRDSQPQPPGRFQGCTLPRKTNNDQRLRSLRCTSGLMGFRIYYPFYSTLMHRTTNFSMYGSTKLQESSPPP